MHDNDTPEAPDTEATTAVTPVVGVEETEDVDQADTPEDSGDATENDEPDTFPREYVEQLRNENARYRQRANLADELARRLHVELVRATGRLADPTDLPFDEDHLADPDNMAAAIDKLLASKPHLASRRPTGDIGQGSMSVGPANVDLAAILRGRAG